MCNIRATNKVHIDEQPVGEKKAKFNLELFLNGSEEEKTCFKTSDKDGNMGSLSRDVSPSQGLLQSAISLFLNKLLRHISSSNLYEICIVR